MMLVTHSYFHRQELLGTFVKCDMPAEQLLLVMVKNNNAWPYVTIEGNRREMSPNLPMHHISPGGNTEKKLRKIDWMGLIWKIKEWTIYYFYCYSYILSLRDIWISLSNFCLSLSNLAMPFAIFPSLLAVAQLIYPFTFSLSIFWKN